MAKSAVVVCVVLAVLPVLDLHAQEVDVLVIVPWYYGANLNFNMDNLQRFGWNVTTAGTTTTIPPCPAYGGPRGCPPIEVDRLITDIDDLSDYEVVAIMPGSMWVSQPYGDLLNSQPVLDLIVDAVDRNLVVFAPCGGVRVLAAADVLDGVTITAHNRFQSEYEAAGAIYLGPNLAPVIDGNIVTATRGMYFHEPNNEAMAEALEAISTAAAGVVR